MNRSDSLSLLQSSFTARRADYARKVAQAWLVQSPNDLAMKFFLARAHQIENDRDDAIQLLDQIVAVDLEHAAAQRSIGDLKQDAAAHAVAHALDGQPFPSQFHPPHWIDTLRRANAALHIKQFDSAHVLAHAVLDYDDAPPLASLILLKSHWLAGQLDLALPLAQGFNARMPQSVAILLCLAECLLQTSEVSATHAVELLYSASTLDPACDVVNRYWSSSHLYRNLWNHDLDVPLPAPIPFEVTKLLGKNQIDGVKRSAKSPTSRNIGDVALLPETKIEHTVTLKTNQIKVNHARFYRRPVHVILYSGKLLKAKFGEAAATEVIGLVEQLAAITAKHRRLPVKIVAPDDPVCLARYGLTPVESTNAWAIKNLLRDVDRWLTRKGQAINSLAIIGGDDLIPFHRLPNPTDDSDGDIPSDNPYGCMDENYFVPEWAVGRLPSPCGRDPEPLKRLLRNTINAHASTSSKFVLMDWVRDILRMNKAQPAPQAIGYAASVWKEAALEVFAPIGAATQLFTSPPLEADTAPSTRKIDLSYFNLHGVEDSSEWYGQRDPGDEGYGALYPVALKPSDVAAPRGAGQIVFTESCYGANIIGKSEPDAAMCLRFLNDGVRALIGSTKIAYGSVSSPLIAADLLARSFWEALLSGLAVGEALRRAKLDLAQTMHKRQNFLDGEDQKTLISFVLYGDPLLPAPVSSRAKSFAKTLPELKTMAMEYQTISDPEIKPEVIAEMKNFLARYLPGSESANIHLSQPLSPIIAKGNNTAPTHRVYTVAKTIRMNSHSIQSYARVTVSKAGKVVKLAVSK